MNKDGHEFKKSSCINCGIGQAAYENLKTVCRNFVDVRQLGYDLVDKYLDAGGDPELVIISQKDLANLTKSIDKL